jgi:glycosyltransferase involved in cell wall biosynthesis
MGLTALESMACGTPAIVSSAGALPEFVEHERTGMVFADEMELRNIIERVVTGALDVERLGEAARRRVEDAYGLLPVGHAMLGAYRAIIN